MTKQPKNIGINYAGKPIFAFGNQYWYLASKHRSRKTALQFNKGDNKATIKNIDGGYGRFFRLPQAKLNPLKRVIKMMES